MFIDLHGLTESEAISKVEMKLMDFQAAHEDSLEIVTGNGIVIKDTVIDILNDHGLKWSFKGSNTGAIIVKR